MSKILVIIPTYNEKDNVAGISRAVIQSQPDAHILFVDDNGTPEIQFDSDSKRFGERIYNLSDSTTWTKFTTDLPTLEDIQNKIYIYKIFDDDYQKTAYAERIPITQFSNIDWNFAKQNNYTAQIGTLSASAILSIKEGQKEICNGKWVQNWLNGIALFPADVASWINKDVFHALNEYGNKPVGTIVMDFPGEGLIYRINKRNFVHIGGS